MANLEWISVKDRLPDNRTLCLVYAVDLEGGYLHNQFNLAFFGDGRWIYHLGNYGYGYEITHWIALTSPVPIGHELPMKVRELEEEIGVITVDFDKDIQREMLQNKLKLACDILGCEQPMDKTDRAAEIVYGLMRRDGYQWSDQAQAWVSVDGEWVTVVQRLKPDIQMITRDETRTMHRELGYYDPPGMGGMDEDEAQQIQLHNQKLRLACEILGIDPKDSPLSAKQVFEVMRDRGWIEEVDGWAVSEKVDHDDNS